MRIRATLEFALHHDKLKEELTLLYYLLCCLYAQRHFELTIYHCEHTRGAFQIDAHKFLVMSTMTTFSLCFRRSQVPFHVVIERVFCVVEWALFCTSVFLYFCSKILVSVVCALLSTQQALLHSSPYLFCFAVRLLHMWDFASVNLLCCYAYKLLASVNLLRLPSFSCRLPQSAFVN